MFDALQRVFPRIERWLCGGHSRDSLSDQKASQLMARVWPEERPENIGNLTGSHTKSSVGYGRFLSVFAWFSDASNGLGKLVLYQLSYARQTLILCHELQRAARVRLECVWPDVLA